jgi:putative tricarboxylic transport membrane protein
VRVRGPADFALGTFLVLAAAASYFINSNVRPGTAFRMGPGYAPRLLFWLMTAIGAALLVRSLIVPGPPLERPKPRALLSVVAALSFFALAIEQLGLPIAIAGVVLIAGTAHPDTRLSELGVTSILLAVLSSILFVGLLGLRMSLLPRGVF